MASRTHHIEKDVSALEAAATSARAGFACVFSSSDEYENALIAARRAEGRYGTSRDFQSVALLGCVFVIAGLLAFAF
ncbi:MAG: hypothetical protein K2W78_15985 [Xanthobacteraceae bacterium]|nr:hypothetical protein [Xanthobacteraceae bacterium]